MKNTGKIFFLLISLLNCFAIHAQNVKLTGTLKNIATTEVTFYRPAKVLSYYNFKDALITVPVTKGQFTVGLTVGSPEMIELSCTDSITGKDFSQLLFFKKGYELNIILTLNKNELDIASEGVGTNDNKKLNINSSRALTELFNRNDSVSSSVYNYIVKEHKSDSILLAKYISSYQPSPEFIKAWKYEIKYAMLNEFYQYSEGMKHQWGWPYNRNYDKWIDIQDKLFATVPLSDDNALVSFSYRGLIRMFLIRKHERLVRDWRLNKYGFLTEWYGMDTAKANKEFLEDMTNRPWQKIIERNFHGKVKEYTYALLLENAIESSDLKNIQSIYADFAKEFPASSYSKKFQPEFSKMFSRAKQPLTDKMVFVKDGDKINIWENILSLVKGKTVFLDMWGTWCVPCRQQLEKNSHAIKEYFKGKELGYLYIANYDQGNEQTWKQLIAYFGLEGSHILANKKLTEDIMSKVKGTSYPTYIIIHKDGSFELSKAGSPLNRELLIAQIEQALQ